MFEAFDLLFLYTETPLHAGSGRGMGAVDLPIQREVFTQYPMVQANGVRGPMRAIASATNLGDLDAIFGPDTENADKHAGALSVGDARLLLFPVRSLAGVFAWATSRDLLARLLRDLALTGDGLPFSLPPEPQYTTAWVTESCTVTVEMNEGDRLVLEEFPFEVGYDHAEYIQAIAEFLRDHALPQTEEYAFWRESLPKRLCILPEKSLRDFTLYSTEVQTHIKLALATKTVEGGMLWTQEALPTDSLLYSPLMATASRRSGTSLTGEAVLSAIRGLTNGRMQIGGDETTGQGRVALKFYGA